MTVGPVKRNNAIYMNVVKYIAIVAKTLSPWPNLQIRACYWCKLSRIELLNCCELTSVSCSSNLIRLIYFNVMPRKSVISICRFRTFNRNETIENGHLNNSLPEDMIYCISCKIWANCIKILFSNFFGTY